MKILAVDTATALCGVAVLDARSDGSERSATRRRAVTTHSEMLLPLVAECLSELDLRPADLTAVACVAGPGSFTGLRIGLATAKGLCFALGLPLTMVSSLAALAERGLRGAHRRPLLAVLPAFRGQVFARLFAGAAAETAPVAAALFRTPQLMDDGVYAPQVLADAVAGLAPVVVGCEGPWGGTRCDDDLAPHPLDVARLGVRKLAAGEIAALRSVVPNYLCVSAAEEALGAGRAP